MFGFQVLRSFGYLAINHPAKKVIDWYVPIFMAIISTVLLSLGRGLTNVWGDGGLVSSIQGLVQGLPGFYIAGLAVVATFGKQAALDSLIPEPTPTIETWYGTGKMEIGLTRRRFLCLLFAHLTALSILLSIGAAFLMWSAPLAANLNPIIRNGGFYTASFLYTLFLFQLLVVTLWGLYYLSDKIHQPDAKPLIDDADQQERP